MPFCMPIEKPSTNCDRSTVVTNESGREQYQRTLSWEAGEFKLSALVAVTEDYEVSEFWTAQVGETVYASGFTMSADELAPALSAALALAPPDALTLAANWLDAFYRDALAFSYAGRHWSRVKQMRAEAAR